MSTVLSSQKKRSHQANTLVSGSSKKENDGNMVISGSKPVATSSDYISSAEMAPPPFFVQGQVHPSVAQGMGSGLVAKANLSASQH